MGKRQWAKGEGLGIGLAGGWNGGWIRRVKCRRGKRQWEERGGVRRRIGGVAGMEGGR